MSEHKLKQANQKSLESLGLIGRLLAYNPYKAFDTRRGCVAAIALCFACIAIFILNFVINKNWPSIIFVPLYLVLILNRLKKLRSMA